MRKPEKLSLAALLALACPAAAAVTPPAAACAAGPAAAPPAGAPAGGRAAAGVTLTGARLTRTAISVREGLAPRAFRLVVRLAGAPPVAGLYAHLGGTTDQSGGAPAREGDGTYSQRLLNQTRPGVYPVRVRVESPAGAHHYFGGPGDPPIPTGPLTLTITD
ncbi:MAG TPA: hypothetical protein VFY17_08785 [Pilimelia sp.]|nr:hypothetical protein [Pilimelia sp.]